MLLDMHVMNVYQSFRLWAVVERADVAQAVHETYPAGFFQKTYFTGSNRKLKCILELQKYEFSNPKSFKHGKTNKQIRISLCFIE